MESKQLTLPGEIVKKDNQLIRSRTNVTKTDQARIIAMLVACIRHDDVDFKETYSIAIKEFLSDYASGIEYTRVKEQCKDLIKSFIEVENREKGRDKNGFYPFKLITFFTSIEYENGFVNARFNPEMKPYLLELKSCFTKYNLLEYLKLSSSYSQKIFELLKSWANTPEFTMSIEDLHRILNTPPTFRSNFKAFRVRVLQQAEKEINKKTELFFCWEAIKQGRSFVAVKFMFARKKDKEEEVKRLQKEKQSKINNKYFLLSLTCFKEKKGENRLVNNACLDENTRTLKCSVCKKANYS